MRRDPVAYYRGRGFVVSRYELGDRFWQIEQDGSLLKIKQGVVGNKGRSSTKYFPTDAAAREALDVMVAEKLAGGYRVPDPVAPIPPAPPPSVDDEAQRAALEARITEDPDDDAAYEVYGDWLLRHGHPRGELMALMRAADAIVKPGALQDRAKDAVGKHIERHKAVLLAI